MSLTKILIIENDQFLREFYQELLQAEGYLVDVAADGETGLKKIQENEYELVLLDIKLPKKDGLQILHDLKIRPPVSDDVSIVVLANSGQEATIKKCFDLGAAGFLIKSVLDAGQVLSEIRNFLPR